MRIGELSGPAERTQYLFDRLAKQHRRLGTTAAAVERTMRALRAIVGRLAAERPSA